jgi:hypothetical protein
MFIDQLKGAFRKGLPSILYLSHSHPRLYPILLEHEQGRLLKLHREPDQRRRFPPKARLRLL